MVDFLVTEDQGLHSRAHRISATLGDRVLYVADAVSLLRTTFEAIEVALPAIREVDAHSIPLADPIFASLRADYAPFDIWWRDKCVKAMRKCWIVMDGEKIAGLVVRKDKSANNTDASLSGRKILKLCTFKVRPESRGVKLGELLLKQALWYAQSNYYDTIYVTSYSKQKTLIALLEYYGFTHTYDNSNGEMVFEKALPRDRLDPQPDTSLFDLARINYPRFAAGDEVSAYAIPIVEEFHEILFPELVRKTQLSLFDETGFQTPGNTIRKVYLCRASARISQPGALLFFYKGKSSSPPSQAITTVGIFEEMKLAHSTDELRRLASRRSVYSDAQLKAMGASHLRPVKVINFLLARHLERPMELAALKEAQVFANHPPQSIKHIATAQMRSVLSQTALGFAI